MFSKFISKIFPVSKETQAYTQMFSTLREILLPLGFTESQEDIQASLSKQSVFRKGTHQITFYYDMRDRAYALLTPNEVLFSLSFPDYNEGSIISLRNAVEQWAKRVE